MARHKRLATYAALAIGWSVLAAWQYAGYRHERYLIHETLHQQSHSLMNAMIGGIRSHRRLGCFFEEQLEGMLEELVKSEDVLAVAVTSDDGQKLLSSGKLEPLDLSPPVVSGDSWDAAGFRLVEQFQLLPADCPVHRDRDEGSGDSSRKESTTPCCLEHAENRGPFAGGGRFIAVLLLDRTRSDAFLRSAAWSHASLAAAGALVLLCIALAWRASVQLVDARGRARVLEIEARHFRELSQAAAGLAHETRNPLGLVRGWTQRLAQSDLDSVESQEHAQTVVEECDRVTARINQFLAFARPCEPVAEPVDPESLIDELAAVLQPDLESKNLRLQRVVPRPDQTIRADRELLRQAMFNLMQNAIQFAADGDTINVAVVGGSNGSYRIEVSDRGCGVAGDAVESLFTPYFTTRPDGTGLGLAIVRRIATAHGWEATYSPRPGGGSVFSLDNLHG